ncbi:MAG: helix-turn-helix domain-containing protein [Nitrosopumilaceae archaeon]
MAGLDSLLARSLGAAIEDNLGEDALHKIDNRLFEKYGITINQAILDFQKLDGVLREFFGAGADGLEKKIFETVCTLEKSKTNDQEWMTVEDQFLTRVILEAFGDDDKKEILTALLEQPRIVSEVLCICNIPQTSGYRKINWLIDNGLLTTRGFITTPDGKRVNKYIPVFENIKINIVKNKVTVKVQLNKESMNNSLLIPLIQNYR